MKRRAVILSMLVILLVFQIFNDINSEINLINGNIAYTAFPASDAPISMDNETLTVDNKIESIGNVNDKYFMTNTSSEKVSLPIIFPVLKNNNEHKDIKISVNDEEKDYSIKWLLDSEKYVNNNDINIDELLYNLNYKQNYKYKNINPDEMVWIYEILLEDKNNEIKIENNEEPLKILYKPLDIDKFKVTYSSNSAEFSMNKSTQDKYQIVLFDSQIEHIIFDSNSVYEKKKMRLSQYVRQVTNRYYNENKSKFINVDINTELVPHVLYYIDQNMELSYSKPVSLDNILNNFVDIVYYTVEFEPNEVKTMELSYIVQSTKDKIKTVDPIHTFKYDLSASKHWKSFNNFDIEFNLGENYKYLIESSIKFAKYENKFTSSLLNNTPESLISYSIFKENINLDDLLEVSTKKKIKVVSSAFFMILVIFIVYKIATRKSENMNFLEENKND